MRRVAAFDKDAAVRIAAVLLVMSCGPLTPFQRLDGGTTGGGTTAGGMAAGGTTAGGTTVGGTTAGGTTAGGTTAGGTTAGGTTAGGTTAGGTTAGGTTAGGTTLGAFIWTSLAVSPPVTTTTQARCVAAREGEAYISLESVGIYRSTGGVFSPVGVPYTADQMHVTTDGKVFAGASGRSSWVCPSACDVAGSWRQISNGFSAAENFKDVCGSGDEAFLLSGRSTGNGALYRFDQQAVAWVQVVNDLGIAAERCVGGPNGTVFVAGDDGVVRFEAGGVTAEPIDLLGQPTAWWQAIALTVIDGGVTDAMVVGLGGGYRSARRSPNGTWRVLPLTSPTSSLFVTFATGAGEYLALGSASGSAAYPWWDGSGWGALPNPLPGVVSYAREGIAVSPREVFVVGRAGNSYAIVRGRR